ncbi:hypothetical protein NDU88_005250 [Pleurodeles waltl]|uniref:Uncharacterized protein n=1 Tax=Pleurodeles waltl TaxID=8319 RepID=A0AAV7SL92_PLEWA|nr:hypothetical protein NDU88_005250 [Pleurodeles waltl]
MKFKGALGSRPLTTATAASVLRDPRCGRVMKFKGALGSRPLTTATAASVLRDPWCGRAMKFKGALGSHPLTTATAASVLRDPRCGRAMKFKGALGSRPLTTATAASVLLGFSGCQLSIGITTSGLARRQLPIKTDISGLDWLRLRYQRKYTAAPVCHFHDKCQKQERQIH